MKLISTFFFSCSSAKNLKIMNLGEDGVEGSGAVAAALQSTIDDPDPYLNGIKNQAGDEESDEEVLLVYKALFYQRVVLDWST
jgi:hypothetical protein